MPDRTKKPLVLVLEDEIDIRDKIKSIMEEEGFTGHKFATLEEALSAIDTVEYDAYVVDLNLPNGRSGIEFLQIALEKRPRTPFAVVSAYLDDSWGARLSNFFIERGKPLDSQISKPGFREPLKDWARAFLVFWRDRQAACEGPYHSEDVRVKQLRSEVVPIVASSALSVLILGESGTGKERLARFIHENENNPFRSGPFVAVNCAAVSDQLILSDLFGHVEGAFTGADEHRLGWFLEASGWRYETLSAQKAKRESVKLVLNAFGLKDLNDLHQKVIAGGDFDAQARKINDCMQKVHELLKALKEAKAYVSWLSKSGNEVRYAKYADEDLVGKGDKIFLMGNYYEPVNEENAEFLYVQNAKPGTIFLDEIGDLSPAAEVALLRVLDGYGIRPVGYTGPSLLPDCRIIAATNRIRSRANLREPHENTQDSMTMRKDLYYRLEGWVLELPPLRERKDSDGRYEWITSLRKWAAEDRLQFSNGDLEQFAQELMSKSKRLWDGNWRELRHVYDRAKALAVMRPENRFIRKEDLDYASQWVLVEGHQRENDNNSKRAGTDNSSENNQVRGGLEGPLNSEVEQRLDCILAIRHVLTHCNVKTATDDEKIMNVIKSLDFVELRIDKDHIALVTDKNNLLNAVKRCKREGRVINTAVDILMGNKSGALKAWWKKNAATVVSVVTAKIETYRPILADLKLMGEKYLRNPLSQIDK